VPRAPATPGFVEARAQLFAGSGAPCIEAAGAYAMFEWPAPPLAQTFAPGLLRPAGATDMAELALLDARLGDAAVRRCDLTMIGAPPGSGSQRPDLNSHGTCQPDRA
jgi:hypothetical protein